MNDKSIDIVIEETKENIAKVLNESHLPVSVMGMLMRELTQQITAQERQIIEQLKQENQENELKAE